MTGPVPLGGFFGLDLPVRDAGLWRLWQGEDGLAWSNATSALAALIAHLAPARVWFPAFICAELAEAAPEARRRYFPLQEDLSPDTTALAELAPGDMVLAVNYFGRAPGAAWRAFVAAHPHVHFVEDCAQAIDTGEEPWGGWRLYSPRKIAGIPDGGLLVPTVPDRPMPAAPKPAPPEAILADLAPKLARMERPADNALWHPMNQAREAAHAIAVDAMSGLSRRLMGLVDTDTLSARRHENFRILAGSLRDWAVIPTRTPGFVPFGFPVRIPAERRDKILQRLYAQRIFPAVHWRTLPAPRDFAEDWDRAATSVTLPCDQRQTPEDTRRLAKAFRDAAQTR